MKNEICVGGFVMKDNQYLFGKRSPEKNWAAGLWDIIGGRALKNEDPILGLRREAFEEIGVNVLAAELIKTIEVSDNSKSGNFIYHIFFITDFEGDAVNCSDEHTQINWFTRDQLNNLSLALPDYLTMIDEWTADASKHK